MCYDISYKITLDSIDEYFAGMIEIDPQIDIDFTTSIHILAQAYKKHPIVVMEDGGLKLKAFEWGVIADYMNTPEKLMKMRNSMCNARSEKIVGDNSSYWSKIRHKRCLIPVNGIFEHREIAGWKHKVPYYVRLKDRPMFCLAGLYNYPNRPTNIETGEVVGTFTVITRAANEVMRLIHNAGDNANRMPLFLPKDLEAEWLDPNLTDEGIQQILDYEMPAENLEYRTVWTIRSNKPHPNGGQKTDAYDWEKMPPLGQEAESQQKLF